jgi:hypothetical protein
MDENDAVIISFGFDQVFQKKFLFAELYDRHKFEIGGMARFSARSFRFDDLFQCVYVFAARLFALDPVIRKE